MSLPQRHNSAQVALLTWARTYSTSFVGEYNLTHAYLEFPDLKFPGIYSTTNKEQNVFNEDSAVYLLKG